jgi:hypothetical protein
MGRKRKPRPEDQAPKGVPTLGALLGLQPSNPAQPCVVENPVTAVSDHEPSAVGHEASAEGGPADEAEPSSAPKKSNVPFSTVTCPSWPSLGFGWRQCLILSV